MPIKGLLNESDLKKIAEVLEENGYGESNITVVIDVNSKAAISRINEDFFYRNNSEGTPPDVDEVNVTIGTTKFKYVVVEDGE